MPAASQSSKLGIIAGGGELPGVLAAACASEGRPHFVLGLSGFADEKRLAADVWVKLGEVGKAIKALKSAGVENIVMAGKVHRPDFSRLKMDFKGIAFAARLAGRSLGDDGLMRAIIDEFEKEGFRVIAVDGVLKTLLAPEGVVGNVHPESADLATIQKGFAEAKALGAADKGQSVVARDGEVVDVEDEAGTDALIKRCSGSPGCILVKVKKPQQDRRADLPVVGSSTVAAAKSAGFRGIAVEAGQTLIVDRAAMAAAADAAGLFVIGVK